jgi:outer membrane protein assembly factor BamB
MRKFTLYSVLHRVALAILMMVSVDSLQAGTGGPEEFPLLWEIKSEFEAGDGSCVSPDGKFFLVANDKGASLHEGATGKVIWSSKFKDMNSIGFGKSELTVTNWEADILFLFDKKSLGKDKLLVVKLSTGKELWSSEEYSLLSAGEAVLKGDIEDMIVYFKQLDAFAISQKSSLRMVEAQTGKLLWETNRITGSVGRSFYDNGTGDIVLMNFKPTGLGQLFTGFKNQLMRINAKTGEVKWEVPYRGTLQKKLLTREILADLRVEGSHVLLRMGGLQVFNFSDGKLLWGAQCEETLDEVKPPVRGRILGAGIYGAISEPLYDGEFVYILANVEGMATNDRRKTISKYEVNTGKLIWTSEKFVGGAVPALILVEEKIISQIGGFVNYQAISRETVRNQDGSMSVVTYRSNGYTWIGPFGVKAIDAQTGTLSWSSERFDKKRITEITTDGKRLFVASGDEFYAFEAKTGDLVFNQDHTKQKVGKPLYNFDGGDKTVIVSEKGLAAYSKKDGSVMYSTDKVKQIDSYFRRGKNFFLENLKEQAIGIDLTNGNIKGITEKAKKGFVDYTEDGEFIFTFEKKEVQKYKTNS